MLGLAAVSLVGCAAGAPSCERVADSAPDVTGVIKVSGATGDRPEIALPTPFHTKKTAWADVTSGAGTPITSKNQLVVLDVTLVDGTTGKPVVGTAYDGTLTKVFSLSQWESSVPAFSKALQCATAGSRVKVAIPPGGFSDTMSDGSTFPKDHSAVAVVDVRKVYLTRATGTVQFNQGQGLPAIVRAPDGRPGVIVPDGAAPDHVVAQTLVKGAGAVVDPKDLLRLAYTAVDWTSKAVASTTWDAEPQSVAPSSLPTGVADALRGATVGSQLMVVVPKSKLGAGASDTEIFVIDILGVDAPGTTNSQ